MGGLAYLVADEGRKGVQDFELNDAVGSSAWPIGARKRKTGNTAANSDAASLPAATLFATAFGRSPGGNHTSGEPESA